MATALILLSSFGPALASRVPPCLFKSLVGFACASCGATRSALALARFDLVGALSINPLATLAWACLILGGLVAGVAALFDRPLPELRLRPTLSLRLAAALALLANWAYLIHQKV